MSGRFTISQICELSGLSPASVSRKISRVPGVERVPGYVGGQGGSKPSIIWAGTAEELAFEVAHVPRKPHPRFSNGLPKYLRGPWPRWLRGVQP